MSWQQPKTDWEIKPRVNGMYNGDWFNLEDYERITCNLATLQILGSNIYGAGIPSVGMPTRYRTGYPRAEDFNAIENNLLALAQKTVFPATYSGRKLWEANGSTPTVDDLNRIEGAILTLHENYLSLGIWAEFIPADSEDGLLTADGTLFLALEV